MITCIEYITLYDNFSYDVVVTSTMKEILAVFNKFDSRVVFSAEGFCWPDSNLIVSLFMLSNNNILGSINSG